MDTPGIVCIRSYNLNAFINLHDFEEIKKQNFNCICILLPELWIADLLPKLTLEKFEFMWLFFVNLTSNSIGPPKCRFTKGNKMYNSLFSREL